MKKNILGIAFVFMTMGGFAQNYLLSDQGSVVKFAIKNFGLTVNGNLKGLKGEVSFNPAAPATASIQATVDAATINTGNGSRDGHLKKEEYFNVVKYPTISFASTSIQPTNKANTFLLQGTVTIKGVAKKISFPFTYTSQSAGYLLNGSFTINRRDFGVGGSSLVLSDNLTVTLAVLAKK